MVYSDHPIPTILFVGTFHPRAALFLLPFSCPAYSPSGVPSFLFHQPRGSSSGISSHGLPLYDEQAGLSEDHKRVWSSKHYRCQSQSNSVDSELSDHTPSYCWKLVASSHHPLKAPSFSFSWRSRARTTLALPLLCQIFVPSSSIHRIATTVIQYGCLSRQPSHGSHPECRRDSL